MAELQDDNLQEALIIREEPQKLDEVCEVAKRLEVTLNTHSRMRLKRNISTTSMEEAAQNTDTVSSSTQQS